MKNIKVIIGSGFTISISFAYFFGIPLIATIFCYITQWRSYQNIAERIFFGTLLAGGWVFSFFLIHLFLKFLRRIIFMVLIEISKKLPDRFQGIKNYFKNKEEILEIREIRENLRGYQ